MSPRICIIISANAEWNAVRSLYPDVPAERGPYGEFFRMNMALPDRSEEVVVLHGGWGKIAAAASAQYTVDRWRPELLVNLGTCGGVQGAIDQGEIVLVERTVVYDIVEQMGDPDEAIAQYETTIDLAWLPSPLPGRARRAHLLSADRDLIPDEIPYLRGRYNAIAGDWESGAIAFVAARNSVQCLILRGVTDLVGTEGGEAYTDHTLYPQRTADVMRELFAALPAWLAHWGKAES